MKFNSLEKLHHDHIEWMSYVNHWKHEVNFFQHILGKMTPDNQAEQENISDLLNKLSRHTRMIKEIEESITTHQAFIKDFINTSKEYQVDRQEIVDHYKTREHMLNFFRSYKDLKNKIFDLVEKLY